MTRRARVLVAAGSVAAVVLAGAYTAVQQYRYRYPPEFEWPTFFHRAHVLGWVAVTLLAADVLVELAGPRRREPTASPGPSSPM